MLMLSIHKTVAAIWLAGLITLFSPGLAGAGSTGGMGGQASAGAASAVTLPRYSQAPLAQGREPVTFIYIGTEQQIIDLFISHGWNGADRLTPSSLLRAYRAAEANAPYPTAPFSPAFINGDRQDLEFQMATPANTIRERHHTRIWDTTAVSPDGSQIWVGTASFDDGIQLVGRTKLPVHHIDPDLDAERSFILNSLGLSDSVTYVQFTPGGSGANTFGDPYYTDGRAAVVNLTGQPQALNINPADQTTATATPIAEPAASSPAGEADVETPAAVDDAEPVALKSQPSLSSRFSDFWHRSLAFFGFGG